MSQPQHGNATHRALQTLVIVLLFLIFVVPSVGHAVDGNRRGFVAGAGLGYSPVANWIRSPGDVHVTERAFAIDVIIGHGWDSRNMIVYEGLPTLRKSNYLYDSPVVQGLNGVRWYHFWDKQGRRVYSAVGLGLMAISSKYSNYTGNGFGYCFGVGCDAVKHVQIGLFYIGGSTKSNGVTLYHNLLSLLVTALAY